MEINFDVNITPGVLYDYLLSHVYRTAAGLIGSVVGALLIIAFAATLKVPYLIVGIVIIAYLPWTLFLKSRQQYLGNPAYKHPLHFTMDDDGIRVSQDEGETGADDVSLGWDEIYRVTSSPKSILIYTGRVNAFMLPKSDLKDAKSSVIQMISTHVAPEKVKIRGN